LRVGIPLEGASDRGVSAALYLRDPDGNGVELYWVGRAKSGRARKMASLQWSLEPLIVGQPALIKFPKKWRIRKCCLIYLKKNRSISQRIVANTWSALLRRSFSSHAVEAGNPDGVPRSKFELS